MNRFLAIAAVSAGLCLLSPSASADGCWTNLEVSCHPGQRIVLLHKTAEVCHTLDLWMSDDEEACFEGGDENACKEGRQLWTSSGCIDVRNRNRIFVIISVDTHPPVDSGAIALMKISPVDQRSETYWTAPGKFEPAQ